MLIFVVEYFFVVEFESIFNFFIREFKIGVVMKKYIYFEVFELVWNEFCLEVICFFKDSLKVLVKCWKISVFNEGLKECNEEFVNVYVVCLMYFFL